MKPQALMLLGLLALAVAPARGQCPESWQPSGLTFGIEGEVYASTVWDPDASGPLPPRLAIGGEFRIRSIGAQNVAVFDGSSWTALGAGIGGHVYALAAHGSDLIAGGSFEEAGGAAARAVARWDGSSWSPMPGIGSGSVRALLVHEGDIHAGLHGGAPNVRRWDGSQWQSVGQLGSPVSALSTYQGALVAGTSAGSTAAVLRRTGDSWEALGSMAAAFEVTSMTIHDGELWAGLRGYEGGPSVQRFDGQQWHAMSSFEASATVHFADVRAVASYQGELYAAGDFFDPVAGTGIARWNGTAWEAVGSGLSQPAFPPRSFTPFGGELFVVGPFSTIGGIAANGLAVWNGNVWSYPFQPPTISQRTLSFSFGGPSAIQQAAVLGPELVIGGDFAMNTPEGPTEMFARWDGAAFRPMSGLSAPFSSPRVVGLVEHNGDLWAFGEFRIGSSTVRTIRWSNDAWTPVPGASPDAAAVLDGQLYVAGFLPGLPEYRLARWDGSGWVPVAIIPDEPAIMAAHAGDLYIGTRYDHLLLRWDGASMQQLGLADDRIESMAFFGGDLVVGGGFDHVDGVPVPHTASWNGTTWTPLGAGVGGPPHPQGFVARLHMHNGILYAGAWEGAAVLARWDPAVAQWTVLPDTSPAGIPMPLASHRGALVVGGSWDGPTTVESPRLALWGAPAPSCYANCDCSSAEPILAVADFTCFLRRFAAGCP